MMQIQVTLTLPCTGTPQKPFLKMIPPHPYLSGPPPQALPRATTPRRKRILGYRRAPHRRAHQREAQCPRWALGPLQPP